MTSFERLTIENSLHRPRINSDHPVSRDTRVPRIPFPLKIISPLKSEKAVARRNGPKKNDPVSTSTEKNFRWERITLDR